MLNPWCSKPSLLSPRCRYSVNLNTCNIHVCVPGEKPGVSGILSTSTYVIYTCSIYVLYTCCTWFFTWYIYVPGEKPGVAGILSTSTPARWNIYATGGELRDKDEQKSLKVITLQGFLVIPSPDMWRVTWNPSNYEMKMIFRTRPLKLTRSTCSAAKWRCSSWPDILDQAASKAVPMNMSSTQTVAAYTYM